ncbi:ATP-binding cassette domain-containing protein [Desertihabitans brevis]|uniref:ATP-binding cassette domain-containing protein n=1 Tax=Desertihabitans brevis TaxID=2268447 RepID=A0A367YUF3_9ACTN|nr:ATP-binding cassette domain-containing protein [Desertihabitans brevis]RCK69387.1 ATP-binding cassette domain-containing protein [Desertihabitans brevis]
MAAAEGVPVVADRQHPPTPAVPADALVEVDDVTVLLGGRPVLRGVHAVVRAGEVVAVMGANGSGKTTLVRAVLRLLPVAAGTVRLLGSTGSRGTDWARIGYVPQRSTLNLRNATVAEVVTSGRLPHRRPLLPASRRDRQRVRESLERVGMAARRSDQMVHLSGGQQQRVLVARALAGDPELLVMDEPLAGVDAESQQAIADVLAGLVADGLTALVVLHETGPLRPLLTRALVLQDGRLVHDGPVPEVGLPGGHEHHELLGSQGDHRRVFRDPAAEEED